MSPRHLRVLCFGEVLWDCLPQGRFLGGAPLNVAYHLSKLGCEAIMVSAVGADALGDEALWQIRTRGLSTTHIARHNHLPTGIVQVEINADGQPRYEILQNVAWDEIPLTPGLLKVIPTCQAVVFGTLAARSVANRAALDRLLSLSGPRRILDVNLRTPFDDRERALDLCRRADLLKLNDDELIRLVEQATLTFENEEDLSVAIRSLCELVGTKPVCVTLGARGAVFWRDGKTISAAAPQVQVQDVIGAGDAFTAALTASLLMDDSDAGVGAALERACALGALVASLPGAQPEYDATPFRPPEDFF